MLHVVYTEVGCSGEASNLALLLVFSSVSMSSRLSRGKGVAGVATLDLPSFTADIDAEDVLFISLCC